MAAFLSAIEPYFRDLEANMKDPNLSKTKLAGKIAEFELKIKAMRSHASKTLGTIMPVVPLIPPTVTPVASAPLRIDPLPIEQTIRGRPRIGRGGRLLFDVIPAAAMTPTAEETRLLLNPKAKAQLDRLEATPHGPDLEGSRLRALTHLKYGRTKTLTQLPEGQHRLLRASSFQVHVSGDVETREGRWGMDPRVRQYLARSGRRRWGGADGQRRQRLASIMTSCPGWDDRSISDKYATEQVEHQHLKSRVHAYSARPSPACSPEPALPPSCATPPPRDVIQPPALPPVLKSPKSEVKSEAIAEPATAASNQPLVVKTEDPEKKEDAKTKPEPKVEVPTIPLPPPVVVEPKNSLDPIKAEPAEPSCSVPTPSLPPPIPIISQKPGAPQPSIIMPGIPPISQFPLVNFPLPELTPVPSISMDASQPNVALNVPSIASFTSAVPPVPTVSSSLPSTSTSVPSISVPAFNVPQVTAPPTLKPPTPIKAEPLEHAAPNDIPKPEKPVEPKPASEVVASVRNTPSPVQPKATPREKSASPLTLPDLGIRKPHLRDPVAIDRVHRLKEIQDIFKPIEGGADPSFGLPTYTPTRPTLEVVHHSNYGVISEFSSSCVTVIENEPSKPVVSVNVAHTVTVNVSHGTPTAPEAQALKSGPKKKEARTRAQSRANKRPREDESLRKKRPAAKSNKRTRARTRSASRRNGSEDVDDDAEDSDHAMEAEESEPEQVEEVEPTEAEAEPEEPALEPPIFTLEPDSDMSDVETLTEPERFNVPSELSEADKATIDFQREALLEMLESSKAQREAKNVSGFCSYCFHTHNYLIFRPY